RSADELRVGIGPRQAGEDSDVAALVKTEAAGASCDLRDLPRLEVAAFFAVELRRLGEEKRLAREVDAVAEDVGRRAHLRATRDEAGEPRPPRREGHRAVEAGDPARVELVQLAGESDHGPAAEGDENGAWPKARDAAAAHPVERRLALEEADLDLR